MIRVLLCDDQDLVREGLAAILSIAPSIQVIGTARDGAEAVAQVAATQPDLVLMDLNMPGVTGIEATRLIRERYPQVKVLALTTYDADEWVFDAIRAGAVGYLLKDIPRAGLINAIEGTMAGRTYLDPQIAGKLLTLVADRSVTHEASLTETLSHRERDVLRLLAQGRTNAEIASHLFLAEGTVRNHVSVIFSKLGVADRTQAAVIAIRHGIAS